MTRPQAVEETACNLCGAADYEVVGVRDRDGRPLRSVMCRACGLVWTNPRPSNADMDAYYATEYRADYKGAAAPPLRKIVRGMLGARDRRRTLLPLLRNRRGEASGQASPTVLDVGCGAGELVFLLRQSGVDASGIEPGREYSEFACRALAVPVRAATVDTANVTPASQDMVTMFHCLEHVADPRRVLTIVRGWLKPDGLLVVEVPNVESTVQAPAHRFHYAHLYSFSESTLAALGQAAGFGVVESRLTGDGGNVICVFQRRVDEAPDTSGRDRLPGPTPGLAPGQTPGRAQAARTRTILRGHTALRHYLSATPYRRVVDRFQRRRREDRLLGRLKTMDEVVDWAREDPP